MKRLLLLLLIIITTNISAQDRETEFKVYIPLRTYHFDQNPDMAYHNTEGGHGVVGIYRRTDGRWFNDLQAGVLANSYHRLSFLLQYGVGRSIGKLDISANLGLISGYQNLFRPYIKTNGEYDHNGMTNDLTTNLPSIMRNNGILPAASVSISYKTGIVSPLLVISPNYLNAGIVINL